MVLAVGIPWEPQGHQVPDLLPHATCPPAHEAPILPPGFPLSFYFFA